MLTTLLLVERRVGRLPTKRVALYSEAIQVLLETWNLEGYQPIDLDEARYQLAYVAYQMMIEHRQAVSESKLVQMLKNARKELTGLISDKDSYTSFIKKVERRSALLIQKGYSIDSESSKLETVYEFQHLTFQEYLAAYAIVQKCYPGAQKDDILSNVLKQYLTKEYMKEVILLSVVLLDRWSVDELVESIINKIESEDLSFKERSYLRLLLLQFVADEAPMQNRNIVYESCLNNFMTSDDLDVIQSILCSKYTSEFVHFMEQMDNKRNDLSCTSLLMILGNESLDAYKYYTSYKNSSDSEQVLKAVAILDTALWINRQNITDLLDEIQKVKLKEELFDFVKNDDIKIQKQALSALRMSGFLDKADDFNKYIDLYVLYVNKTNTVPFISECITEEIPIENCNAIRLTPDAIEAVRVDITNKVLYSVLDYKEWLTMFLVLLVYSDNEYFSSYFDDLMFRREKIISLNDDKCLLFEKTDKAFIKLLEVLALNNVSIDTTTKQLIQSFISVLNEAWDSYKKENRGKMLVQIGNEDEMPSDLLNIKQRLSSADIDILIEEIDRKLAEIERLETETQKQDEGNTQ